MLAPGQSTALNPTIQLPGRGILEGQRKINEPIRPPTFKEGAVPKTAPRKISSLPWDKKTKKDAGKIIQILSFKKNKATLSDGTIFEIGNKRQGAIKITQKHLDETLKNKIGAVTIKEIASAPKIFKNVIGEVDKPNMKTFSVLSDDGYILFYIKAKNPDDAIVRFINSYSNRNIKKLP